MLKAGQIWFEELSVLFSLTNFHALEKVLRPLEVKPPLLVFR